jgi:ring-1,2-phenylacetyl-CoA epoxidase subunit PaaD
VVTAAVRAAIAAVADPELPVLTIEELGILRDVTAGADGRLIVTVTPTYLGCPALDTIRSDIRAAARAAGWPRVEVVTAWDPPWTTDRITAAARGKLAAAGIAPPRPLLTLHVEAPPCPRCAAPDSVEVARSGATACTAIRRCTACLEPFDHLKELP